MLIKGIGLAMPPIVDPELELLLETDAKRIVFPTGTVFFTPGDDVSGVYYIKSGRTTHYMANEEGLEKVLYTLSEGWFFGEMALSLGQKTGLYSKAEADVVLLKISFERCKHLLSSSSSFRDAFIRCLSSKLLTARFEVENLTFHSVRERLMRLLCSSVDEDGSHESDWSVLRVKYTHYEIGVIVGAAKVTISKLMNELGNEGFLRTSRNSIKLNTVKYREYMRSLEDR